ncbi:hypothetical protein IGI01_07845 [Bacillus thuringiensis]|nr:hypothetical protein [Bacillus thuringiensis]
MLKQQLHKAKELKIQIDSKMNNVEDNQNLSKLAIRHISEKGALR